MDSPRYFTRDHGRSAGVTIETHATPILIDEGQPLADFRAYWRTVRRHLRLTVAVILGVMVLAVVRIMTQTPLYTATTTIMIEPQAEESGSNALENLVQIEAAANDSDEYYKTQCEILQSPSLAAEVIRTLRLAQNPSFTGDSGVSPSSPAVNPAMITAPGAASMDLATRPPVPQGLIDAYLAELEVTPIPDTNLVKVSFSAPEPRLAATIANAHVAAYGRQQISMHSQQSAEVQRYLQNKLVDIKDQLEKSEAALNDYRRSKGIIPGLISLDGKDAVVLDRLADLSKDLTHAEVARIGLEAQVTLIRKHEYNALAAVMEDPEIQAMQKGLDSLYSQEAALASQFKPSYPPLAKLDAQIREGQARIAAATQKVTGSIQSQYDEAVEKERELQAEMDQQRQETLKLNDAAAQYAILQRDVDTNRELYNAVLTRIKDVAVSGDSQATNVSIVNPAVIPLAPSSPNRPRDLMLALVLGLAAGVGLAFGLEYFDNTLKNPEEAERFLGLPNLALVPDFASVNGKPGYAPAGSNGGAPALLPAGRELVTALGSYSQLGEAYRGLRTALLMSRAGGPPRITLMTSALSREGKTVTSVNTSVMLAQLGGRVLLIDADLRRGRCHHVLQLENQAGLTDVLTGAREAADVIRATAIEHLDFLGSGPVPPNPAELLGSPRMAEALTGLRTRYEYILIDSAPVLPVSDSLLLTAVTDGVVLVVDSSATPRQQVLSACARLEYARAKILGVVLNKVRISSPDYKYYNHHEYY